MSPGSGRSPPPRWRFGAACAEHRRGPRSSSASIVCWVFGSDEHGPVRSPLKTRRSHRTSALILSEKKSVPRIADLALTRPERRGVLRVVERVVVEGEHLRVRLLVDAGDAVDDVSRRRRACCCTRRPRGSGRRRGPIRPRRASRRGTPPVTCERNLRLEPAEPVAQLRGRPRWQSKDRPPKMRGLDAVLAPRQRSVARTLRASLTMVRWHWPGVASSGADGDGDESTLRSRRRWHAWEYPPDACPAASVPRAAGAGGRSRRHLPGAPRRRCERRVLTARPTNYERGGGTAIVAAGGALGRVAAIVAAAGTTGAAMR